MVADDVSVSTNHVSEKQARQLSLRDVHGQYLVRLVDKQGDEVPEAIQEHGTAVRLKLRPSADMTAVAETLKHWIVFPNCDVWLTVDDESPIKVGYDSVEDALKASMIEAKLVRAEGNGLRTVYDAPVEIRTVVDSGVQVAFAVSWSRWLEEWQYVRADPRHEQRSRREFVFGVCVGGVRVTTEPPGFVRGGIAAIANADGKGAPRTNVARSAIEKTEEYDELLRRIYAAYVGHITSEMNALESSRAASVTRAAQEATYLAEDLGRNEPESRELLDNQFRNAPAFVVEQAGVRKRLSLLELAGLPSLSSIESTTLSNFESVLRSVRGASSASLRNLLDAMGSAEALPDEALICGISRHSIFGRMFTAEWEVVRLESDNESRTLRARWERRGPSPRWLSAGHRNDLPASLALRMDRDPLAGRMKEDVSHIFFPQDAGIEAVGLEGQLVLCQGLLLVLPGHGVLDVQAATPDVPENARRWCMGWLLSLLAVDEDRYAPGGRLTRVAAGRPRTARWLSSTADSLRNAGLFDVLDEATVQTALAEADFEVVDVQRWDRRRDPEYDG
jgi:molecular chaperone HtpG